MKLLVAPHDDDAELFAAFTCIRERPLVVICTSSFVQGERGLPVTAAMRHGESRRGIGQLGCSSIFLGVRDTLGESEMQRAVEEKLRALAFQNITAVWAPAYAATGHDHHNAVAVAAGLVYGDRIARRYLTYDRDGKQRAGEPVHPEHGTWIQQKLRALACHESQMNLDPRMGCWTHFLGGLEEFYEVQSGL